MKNWKDALISTSATIEDAIKVLDETAVQICLVVDGESRLLGTVTDGDIRRGILRSLPFSSPVEIIMNHNPHISSPAHTRENRIKIMSSLLIHQIPVVDEENRVIGLEALDSLVAGPSQKSNWVVLMAGGLGMRLRPLTNDVPKPMLKIGDRPILENIIGNFVEQGFHRFYISVNYKAQMIKDHFGDGSRWNAEIRYLNEAEPLGTAGSLRLIDEFPDQPLVVMNSDVLTTVNFQSLLTYHQEQGSTATMAVRQYDFTVPYGVVRIEGSHIVGIEEKPVHHFLVNAGIYVIDPEALRSLPDDQSCDMPDLLNRLVGKEQSVAVFPIREYWLDIGRVGDYQQGNREFEAVHKGTNKE